MKAEAPVGGLDVDLDWRRVERPPDGAQRRDRAEPGDGAMELGQGLDLVRRHLPQGLDLRARLGLQVPRELEVPRLDRAGEPGDLVHHALDGAVVAAVVGRDHLLPALAGFGELERHASCCRGRRGAGARQQRDGVGRAVELEVQPTRNLVAGRVQRRDGEAEERAERLAELWEPGRRSSQPGGVGARPSA